MKKPFKIFLISATILFALIGATFTGVFFAMQFGLLNVRGNSTERNGFFQKTTPVKDAPLPKEPLVNTEQNESECVDSTATLCKWNETREWQVVKGGLEKDVQIIKRVSKETGVNERLISAIVVPEQIRFFTAEREVFKRYFEPLKILGSLSKFSLGVSGIKQETATLIEEYALDTSSPFYPGKEYATLIAYQTNEPHDTVLYNRLTDPKDHYYSYLYTALFIKEIEAQWKMSGYDISKNPGVMVTLFNLGFPKSKPKPNPELGGAPISTGGYTYSYGQLGALYYASDELADLFEK